MIVIVLFSPVGNTAGFVPVIVGVCTTTIVIGMDALIELLLESVAVIVTLVLLGIVDGAV